MRLGVTGGVGTGKSLVMRLLGDLGAITFSADEAARQVTRPGNPIVRRIAEQLGPEVLRPDGSLDRGRAGAIVFADPEARRRLEALTHPAILELLRLWMADAALLRPQPPLVAVEVPLLYEAGLEDWFDRVLVVAANQPVQLARLQARTGLSREEALGRIAAQMPLAEKVARADFAVWNDGTPEDLAKQVRGLWRVLVGP